MKSIAFIAYDPDYALQVKENISAFFEGEAEINCYVASELGPEALIEEDVVITSTYALYQNLRGRLENVADLFVIDRTLYKKTIEELKKIPAGTRALIVNLDYKNTMEFLGLLKEGGVDNIEMFPYWPGADLDRTIELAITPDERHLVPKSCKEIIDIGERPINMNQIYRIADAIGVKDPLKTPKARELYESLMETKDHDFWLREMMSSASKQDSILSLIDNGIILANNLGNIYYINDIARKMLSAGGYKISGFNVFDVIPELRKTVSDGVWRPYETMIRVNGREVMCQLKEIRVGAATDSALVILEDLAEAEKKKHKYLKKMRGAGHYAKYTFDDIHGESPSIIECRNIAHRLARSDSNVYIRGESGVGKELFAQSIHNASARRIYPFVAINCSALPENLLESELYGYEEGSFTGAAKGGKIGLFELAHRGTLFLDEVAELSKPLQAKLLRAIEEKTILRIGGRELIPVDVRIICATNKDLLAMVKAGNFREDLYYRLCVLPLLVPPLRERRSDILLLFEALKKECYGTFVLDPAAERRILDYSWPGNVRELKNVVEYLVSLDQPVIGAEDLPFTEEETGAEEGTGTAETASSGAVDIPASRTADQPGYAFAESDEDVDRFILSEMYDCLLENRPAGRRSLAERARECRVYASEHRIKEALARLNEKGLIVSGRGRGGSRITEKGIEALRKWS